jgi:multiple sugar transport system ATP-binding protein
LRNDLRLELKRIQQDLGATMLYVTHDQTEALTLATRVGVLQAGRLVQLGTPRQIYEEPTSSYVASRLGTPRINLVPRAALPALAAPERTATIGIRSEHLILSTAPAAHGGDQNVARVLRIERLSDQYLVHVAIDGGKYELIAASAVQSTAQVGDPVQVSVRRALWFDASEQRIVT